MKSRDLSLDIIRILACCLVVLMHSPIPSADANGPFLAALSFFTAPCIGLFFMVSGALLLPVEMDYFTFIKKRLTKILIPTLIWTAIYLALNLYYSESEINILRALASVPFSAQGNGVLWFMYTLVGLYLLAPILSGWLKTAADRELRFVLLLWVVSLCYPLLEFGVEINSSTTGILYYFTGYAGYFLLGYALKSGRLNLPIVIPAVIALLGVALLIVLKRYNIEYDFYSLFWYESIFEGSLCCLFWKVISWLTPKASIVMGGGYLSGCQYFIWNILWRIPNAHPNNAQLALEYAVDWRTPQLYFPNADNSNLNSTYQCSTKCADESASGGSPYGRISPQKVKPRLYFIDNLRVLACFLVLLTHSVMSATNPDKEGVWLFGLSFIGSPSSELFLALSGTILLPVKTGFKDFYKRRFAKLLPPLVIWSILGILLYTQTWGITWYAAFTAIINIPVQPAIGVYWFVYAMVGLYLIAPFISPWLQKSTKCQLEFFLLLWCVNMLIPWIKYFLPGALPLFQTTGNYYWTLCYFGGFLGYWLLGYYLRKYPVKIGMNIKWIGIVIGSVAYPVFIAILKIRGFDVVPLTDNLQIGSAFLIALLYTLMQNINLKAHIQKTLTHIAKYSFGIYLTHIYIARELYWGLFEGSTIHIFPRTFLIAALTLVTVYLLTYVLSKLPKGKYITGA